MKSTSKVIMGAIVVMVVCLALVLCLILVLLAELYCSLLLRRRRQLRMDSSPSSSSSSSANTMPLHHLESETASSPSTFPPLRSYYSHGVLQAPRSILFPVVSSCKDSMVAKARNQLLHHQHHVIEFEVDTPEVGDAAATSSPPTSLSMSPQTFTLNGDNGCDQSACTGCGEHLVYISNPIYDNDANRVVDSNNANTPPFETPHSSPSFLETCGSSSSSEEEEEEEMENPSPSTPPLTPMKKKLPTEACSVSLRDASGSDSVDNDVSSSSSASPSTSPSW